MLTVPQCRSAMRSGSRAVPHAHRLVAAIGRRPRAYAGAYERQASWPCTVTAPSLSSARVSRRFGEHPRSCAVRTSYSAGGSFNVVDAGIVPPPGGGTSGNFGRASSAAGAMALYQRLHAHRRCAGHRRDLEVSRGARRPTYSSINAVSPAKTSASW